MTRNEYIAAEPEKVEAYKDQQGKVHATRDLAIAANLDHDFRAAVMDVLRSDAAFEKMPVSLTYHVITQFLSRNPSMARVMIGDRDAT